MAFSRKGTPESILATTTVGMCLKCGQNTSIIINGHCPMCQDTPKPIKFDYLKKLIKSTKGK